MHLLLAAESKPSEQHTLKEAFTLNTSSDAIITLSSIKETIYWTKENFRFLFTAVIRFKFKLAVCAALQLRFRGHLEHFVFSSFRSFSIDSLRTEGAGRDWRAQSRAADGGDWDSGQNESSAKQLMIREAYQTLWLIYVLHGSSCLLMQLFTYLVHGDYFSFLHCDWIWKQIKQATEISTD